MLLLKPRHTPRDINIQLELAISSRTHLTYHPIYCSRGDDAIDVLMEAVGSRRNTNIRGILTDPDNGRRVYHFSTPDGATRGQVIKLVSRLKVELDQCMLEFRQRPRFILDITHPQECAELEGMLETVSTFFITGWRSVVSESDMAGYVGALMHNRPGPGPLNLYESYVQQFCGFDKNLADNLALLSDHKLLAIKDSLLAMAGESDIRDAAWSNGGTDFMSNKERSHALLAAKILVENKSESSHYAQAEKWFHTQEWRAQLACIFPWIESVRYSVIKNIYGDRILALINEGLTDKKGNPINSLDDIEYSDLAYLIHNKFTSQAFSENTFVLAAREIRNELAHRRPASISLIMKMLDAWHSDPELDQWINGSTLSE